AGPPAEGREGVAVVFSERTSILRIVVRIFAEDLRRIVVHRHGSSLVVLMGGRACGPGSYISPSVCQTTRDFDTQRTGAVALRRQSGFLSSRWPGDDRVGAGTPGHGGQRAHWQDRADTKAGSRRAGGSSPRGFCAGWRASGRVVSRRGRGPHGRWCGRAAPGVSRGRSAGGGTGFRRPPGRGRATGAPPAGRRRAGRPCFRRAAG